MGGSDYRDDGPRPGARSYRSGPPGGRRDDERGEGRPGPRRGRPYGPSRKVCAFCLEKAKEIDYKNVDMLRRYVTERGKIRSGRKSGTCARHQRKLTVAIKRARHLALLPWTSEHIRRY